MTPSLLHWGELLGREKNLPSDSSQGQMVMGECWGAGKENSQGLEERKKGATAVRGQGQK